MDCSKGPVGEMGVAELRQELAESSNTIYQLRKNQEPLKRQRRCWWQRNGRGQDQLATEQQGPKKGATIPEGAGKAAKSQQSTPKKFQAPMLRTRQKTSSKDEEPDHERVYFVQALVDPPAEKIK